MGGDPPAMPTNESMDQILQALAKNYPELMKLSNEAMAPSEQAKLEAARVTLPGWLELNKSLQPQAEEAARDAALAQVAADQAALAKAGADGGLLDTALAGYRKVDPEYFATREALAKRTGDLLGSININGLSGSEEAMLERSLNRDGNAVPSAQSTASRAMTFGNALGAKRQELANALGVATGTLPAMRSGIEPFQQATGRSGSVAAAPSQFGTPSVDNIGSSSSNLLNSALGSATSLQGAAMGINANRRDSLDRAMQVGNMVGGLVPDCCFIFAEAYLGKLPWWIRHCRDAFYTQERRDGYVAMSKLLVPLMQKSNFARQLVIDLMIAPLSAYGGYLLGIPGYAYGRTYETRTKFFFKLWSILGHFSKKD